MRRARVQDRFGLGGCRVIVTGASQGLGRGIALAAIEAGAEVVGIARSSAGLEETRSLAAGLPGRFEPLPADLGATIDIDNLLAQAWDAAPISCIVHAAGIQLRRPAVDVTREDWRRVTNIHLEVPFLLSAALARRQMAAKVAGSHLFVGSLTSWIGIPNISPYASSKSGILGLTRTLAVEWAAHEIRVNALCPGYFRTALTDDLLAKPEQHERLLSRIPMGRLGTSEDLAGAAIFLLSEASAYVTGQALIVDGGWLAS